MVSTTTKNLMLGIVGITGLFNSMYAMVFGYKVHNNKVIYDRKIVEKGFVNPSNLEILCRDVGNTKADEVMLRYNGQTYFLLETEKGDPYVAKIKTYAQKEVEHR